MTSEILTNIFKRIMQTQITYGTLTLKLIYHEKKCVGYEFDVNEKHHIEIKKNNKE